MTWEEKLMALRALGDASLKMRKPGEWYVSQDNVSVTRSGVLRGLCGNGSTPIVAVENHWRHLVESIGTDYIVCRATQRTREAFRWNGFMWERVDEGLKNEA